MWIESGMLPDLEPAPLPEIYPPPQRTSTTTWSEWSAEFTNKLKSFVLHLKRRIQHPTEGIDNHPDVAYKRV
jgi:hypothetical protein